MSTHKTIFLLFLLLIFSFAIRIRQLDKNPAGFFCDEALMGIDALSIANTGKDHHGLAFPLFFRGFDYDNTSPYQVYLTLPTVKIFGLNEEAVRLTPVIWSIIELFIFFLFLKEIIPVRFSLLGMLLLSISPWHFHLSRINIGDYFSWTLLTLTASLFLIKYLKKKQLPPLALASVFFGLASYSYTPARLVTPLIFFFVLILILLTRKFKRAVFFLIIYSIVLIPFIHFHLSDPHSFQRIKYTMGIDLNNLQNLSQASPPDPQFIINKYFQHYSYQFLFQKGDADFAGQFIKRHSISGLGLLYPYQSAFLFWGLIWTIYMIFRKKRRELILIIILLILFPVADSLAKEGTPFATRSYLGVLPLQTLVIFGIFGLYQLGKYLKLWKNRLIKFVVTAVLAASILFSFTVLLIKFQQNPLFTSDFWGWQYGPREIMKYFLSVSADYDDLYISGEYNGGQIFLPFYDPQNKCRSKCIMGDFFSQPIIVNANRKQLFAISPNYLGMSKLKNRFTVKKTIYYPNNSIAFFIGEIKPE